MKAHRRPPSYQYPTREGNAVELLIDGNAALDASLEAINQARSRVWFEIYIFEPDNVGNLVREALIGAAQRGCDTILMIDGFGSGRITKDYVRPIEEAGARVILYNPTLPRALSGRKLGRKFAPFFHRDHRKLLIADGIGFCGGRNVSIDYAGDLANPGSEMFYDFTLRIDGPVVQDLADSFQRPLAAITNTAPPRYIGQDSAKSPSEENGVPVRVLLGNRRLGAHDLDQDIRSRLGNAKKQCLLVTPYLIPPNWFLNAISNAALRGVEVIILTAGKSDLPFVQIAGNHLYGDLMKSGVRVYEMIDHTLHAKCMVIDGEYTLIGSYNIDVHGSRHNLEIGVGVTDTILADQLHQTIFLLVESALAMTMTAWKTRSLFSRILSSLLSRLFRF